jgi:hypothetical protein
MALEPFSFDYKKVKETLENQSFTGTLKDTMTSLQKMLEEDGPNEKYYAKLRHMQTIAFRFKAKEIERILEAAGIAADSTTAPTEDQAKKVAAIKFLRHFHMVGARGSQKIWLYSTPKSYSHYPHKELMAVRTSIGNLKTKLNDLSEQFSSTVKSRLAEAMQLGLDWCSKAQVVASTTESDTSALAKVKRWFGGSDISDEDLGKLPAKLLAGFKKITKSFNDCLVVITDMPSLRNDPNYDLTEAQVLSISNKAEIPRTIYIEKALHENYDISVLHDMKKNWARVLVHEATHIDVRTEDKRYAFRGIAPGTKLSSADAAVNADSWAFFAADCGGALVQGDITRALNGTGGTLTKLEKNWN